MATWDDVFGTTSTDEEESSGWDAVFNVKEQEPSYLEKMAPATGPQMSVAPIVPKQVEKPSFGLDFSGTAPTYRGIELPKVAPKSMPIADEETALGQAYDTAPNKWNYKQTLSELELQKLEKVRPESAKVGSLTEAQKEQQKDTYGVQIAPENFPKNKPVIENATITPTPKVISFANQEINDFVEPVIRAVENISYDLGQNIKTGAEKIGTALDMKDQGLLEIKPTLKVGAGLIDIMFAPVNTAGQQIASGYDTPYSPGDMLNKVASMPFSVAHTVVKDIAKTAGIDESTADDIALITATLAFMAKSESAQGKSRSVGDYKGIADTIYKNSQDLTPEAKKVWREGIKETHPDTGLPNGDYFIRLNEAAAKNDIAGMKQVIKEAQDYKAAKGMGKTMDTSSEIREKAKAGDESAQVSEAIFREGAKQVEKKENMTIETVKYDDGKVSARVTVNTSPTESTTTPFTPAVATKEEAVNTAIEQAKEVIPTEIADTIESPITPTPTTQQPQATESSSKVVDLSEKKDSLTNEEIAMADRETVTKTLISIGNDFFRGVSNSYKSDVRKAMAGEDYDINDGKKAITENRDYFVQQKKNDALVEENFTKDMEKMYGEMSIQELEKELDKMTKKIDSLQKSSEFKGDKRSTQGATSWEAARVLGDAKMKLERYIKRKEELPLQTTKERVQEEISKLSDKEREKILDSRIKTYEEAKQLYDKKKTPLTKRQMNTALRDVQEIQPQFLETRELGKNIKSAVQYNKPIGEVGGLRVPKSARRVQGEMRSSVQSEGISDFEKKEVDGKEAFKLSQRIKDIIHGLDTRFTRYTSPGSIGTFYTRSKNIALKSLNDVPTVMHELSHLVDMSENISKPLYTPIKRSISGMPIYDPKTRNLRNELTNIYVKYYPHAKKTDALETRMTEGYAVLQQKALSQPTQTKRDFPLSYEKYVEKATGLQKYLNDEMEKIKEDYQGLSDIDTIGSVVTNNLKNKESKSFLTPYEKITQYLANALVPFEKLEKLAGIQGTQYTVSDLMHSSAGVNNRVAKNMTKGKGFWNFKDGELTKIANYNWQTLVERLGEKNELDTFAYFLVARDQYFEWKRLEKLKDEFEKTKDPDLQEKINALSSALEINSEILPKDKVDSVYNQYNEGFQEEQKMFDTMVRSDLDFQKEVGRLSEEQYNELVKKEGYAPMKRLIEDELVGDSSGISMGGFKVTKSGFLKQRTGGMHDIINPILGAITNHKEGVRKGYNQMITNRLFDLLMSFPEFGQELNIQTILQDNGSVLRLAGGKDINKDQNIITKYEDGKPRAILVNDEIREPLELITKITSRSAIERAMIMPARLFSIGTTGAFPLFAISNTLRDQWTAFINSVEGYVPFKDFSPVKASKALIEGSKDLDKFANDLASFESKEAQYMQEYISIGGDLVNSYDFNKMTGEEVLDLMQERKNVFDDILKKLDAGLSILGTPGRVSELGSRLPEYVKARKAGKNMWVAFEEAGRITAPFHHKGLASKDAAGRIFMGGVPYLNAAIQGLSQTIETVKGSKKGAEKWGAVVLGSVAVMAAISAYYENMDEEDKIALQNLDPSIFAQYLIIPKGGGEFYKISMPRDVQFIAGAMFMMIMEKLHGFKYSTTDYLNTLLSPLPDQVQLQKGTAVALSLLLQFLKPSVELATGKKTFPEVKDIESAYDKMLTSEKRYDKSNSLLAVKLGETEFAKSIDLSPKEIDLFLRDTFGRTVDVATMGPKWWEVSNPFIQKEYFTSGRIVGQFFDEAQRVTEIKNTQNKDDAGSAYLDAKVRRINAVKQEIKALRELKEGTVEYTNQKIKVWEAMQSAINFSENDVTYVDKSMFDRKIASQDWAEEKAGIIEKYKQKFNEATDSFKRTRLEKELKEEMGGNKMDSSTKSRYTSLVSELRSAWASENDPFAKELTDLTYVDDKAQLLAEKKAEMLDDGKTEEDFNKYIRGLKQKKVISDAVWKATNKLLRSK